MTGATESALRYYNEKGVITPTVRKETGRKQWLYDDEAIRKLKRLFLLKHVGVSIEEAGKAVCEEELFRETIIKSLEELKNEKETIETQIFIARTLTVANGINLFSSEKESDEFKRILLNDIVKECIEEARLTDKNDDYRR